MWVNRNKLRKTLREQFKEFEKQGDTGMQTVGPPVRRRGVSYVGTSYR